MPTLLHISDLHLGGQFDPTAADALVRIAPTLAPDLIVASGDFTTRATVTEFAAAREFLASLPAVPRVVVPGNHDVPLYRVAERLLTPYRYFREHLSPDLDAVLEYAGLHVVSLNTTSPLRRIVEGHLSLRHRRFCTTAFATVAPDAVRIVVAHHPLTPPPDGRMGVPASGSAKLLTLLSTLGVELVLSGHYHRGFVGNARDRLPALPPERDILLVNSGTTTSTRGRGRERRRNTFNVIAIDDATIRVTIYRRELGARDFAPVSRHEYPRPGKLLSP